MQISLNDNKDNHPHYVNVNENRTTLNNTNSAFQLVPINTPNGICLMTVGSLFDIGNLPRASYAISSTQRGMISNNLQTSIYRPNMENIEKTQLSTNPVECLSSSLETEHTLKNINS